ncbi:hypothetical protein L2750_21790 [Shewanella submarina]|uniref:Uncharacterized protein n=1 Tax=Shewanella submarina TaxID=2016376 RepID=A0ABV7G9L5_9GAMM|nr:hypothetical protein [Shewanella submarina]MCL1039742.1 hypothetical protein [Shewanella submarina]
MMIAALVLTVSLTQGTEINTGNAAPESVGCSYVHKRSRELELTQQCGVLAADGLLQLDDEVLRQLSWSQFGLECIHVFGSEIQNGWYFINQSGLGRWAPFSQDNDCAPFTQGVAVGLSRGKVIFYNQLMQIEQLTDYSWASGFYQGAAKVCRGELVKEFDTFGEHYSYLGGECGFINRDFEVLVPLVHPYESTPSP